MESQKARLLAEIIVKIRLRSASDSERAFLNDWLDESEVNRQTYINIIRGIAISRRLRTEEELSASIDFREVCQKVIRQLTRRNYTYRWIRVAWGSAVALLAGVIVYISIFHESTPIPTSTPVKKTVIAVVPKIEGKTMLVTADGNRVNLEKQIPDSIVTAQALIRGKKGELFYESKPLNSLDEIQEEWNKVITSVGGEYFITLSDGTRVWLNANTTLEFPVNFVKKQREVKLQGEAYFEVASDRHKPFVVITDGMKTRVLGTSFNVKAYDDEEMEQITLLQGSVEVSLASSKKDSSVPCIELKPGMQALWQIGGHSLSMQVVNVNDVIAWRRGEFVFNEENLDVVLHTLSRWYGVCFESADGDSEIYTFSGKLSKDEKLSSILEILTLAGGPRFKIEGDTVRMIKNQR